jgi:hypothetical protein
MKKLRETLKKIGIFTIDVGFWTKRAGLNGLEMPKIQITCALLRNLMLVFVNYLKTGTILKVFENYKGNIYIYI